MTPVIEPGRGPGATSRQIQAAPHGATFVWCNDRIGYARDLAAHLGRGDLDVRPVSALEFGGFGLAGLRAVVLDHAIVSSPAIAAGLRAVGLFGSGPA